MEIWVIVLIVIGAILLLAIIGLIPMALYTSKIAKRLFFNQWRRDDIDKYPRGCSDKDFDYHVDMFNQGMQFRKAHIASNKEISIISGTTRLCGEYYDFGFDRTIIVMPGRMETALYGAYYVEPLLASGYNVLCPDPRGHGISDGIQTSLGKEEGNDVLRWAEFLVENFNQKTIGLFGICGGSTGAAYVFAKEHPAYLRFLICDSMFYSFYDMYKRHIIEEKKPVYPVVFQVLHYIKKYNHVSPYKVTPNKLVKKIHDPILFIGGELDKFATPKGIKKLYKMTPSKQKDILIIPNGRHSHLRYDGKELYDAKIKEFLATIKF